MTFKIVARTQAALVSKFPVLEATRLLVLLLLLEVIFYLVYKLIIHLVVKHKLKKIKKLSNVALV